MWVLYALAAPFLYSVTNFVDKYLLEKRIKDPIAASIFGSAVSSFLGILLFICLGFPRIEVFQAAFLFLAGILLVLYLVPYYFALQMDDTSVVVPLFQFVPLFVLMLSSLFLHESLSLRQFVGFICILLSGYTLSVGKVDFSLFRPRKILWLMMLSSLLYGTVLVLFRSVVKSQDFWTTLSYEMMGGGIGAAILLCFVGIKRFKKVVRQIVPLFGIVSANNSIAIVAQMSEGFALSLVPASLVSIIGGVQPLFLLMLGYFLTKSFPRLIKENIGENIIKKKLLIIVIIFIGLYFIYF
ncbi:MAG: EamA family transporter [bacterium]